MPIELLEHPILLTILCITFLIALYMVLCFILSLVGIHNGIGCFLDEPPDTSGSSDDGNDEKPPEPDYGDSASNTLDNNDITFTLDDEYENIVVKDWEYEYSDKPEERGYYE